MGLTKNFAPLEPGQRVRVYEDPITCQRFEAEAELVEPVGPGLDPWIEKWEVLFDDGSIWPRYINKETAHASQGTGQ